MLFLLFFSKVESDSRKQPRWALTQVQAAKRKGEGRAQASSGVYASPGLEDARPVPGALGVNTGLDWPLVEREEALDAQFLEAGCPN